MATAASEVDAGYSTSNVESSALPQLDLPPSLPTEQSAVAAAPDVGLPAMADLDFPSSDDLTMLPSGAMPLTTSTSSAPLETAPMDLETAPMEFDLGDLTLDLGAPAKPAALPPAAVLAAADIGVEAAADDPLATKLALAQEFNAIGDTDGARTLVEEVVAESSGALKARAQRMLADLG